PWFAWINSLSFSDRNVDFYFSELTFHRYNESLYTLIGNFHVVAGKQCRRRKVKGKAEVVKLGHSLASYHVRKFRNCSLTHVVEGFNLVHAHGTKHGIGHL